MYSLSLACPSKFLVHLVFHSQDSFQHIHPKNSLHTEIFHCIYHIFGVDVKNELFGSEMFVFPSNDLSMAMGSSRLYFELQDEESSCRNLQPIFLKRH